jgi:hypothetical protein
MMLKNDAWVYLTRHSPFDDIVTAFPKGFPVHHPFPTVLRQTKSDSVCPCWELDLSRMSSQQIVYLASVFANMKDLEIEGAIANLRSEGAYLSYYWFERLDYGSESWARTAEIREFFMVHPVPLSSELLSFYQEYKHKWVDGEAFKAPESWFKTMGRLQWAPSTRSINQL